MSVNAHISTYKAVFCASYYGREVHGQEAVSVSIKSADDRGDISVAAIEDRAAILQVQRIYAAIRSESPESNDGRVSNLSCAIKLLRGAAKLLDNHVDGKPAALVRQIADAVEGDGPETEHEHWATVLDLAEKIEAGAA